MFVFSPNDHSVKFNVLKFKCSAGNIRPKSSTGSLVIITTTTSTGLICLSFNLAKKMK